jgi:AAA15 family ATPase/GTPase
LITKVKIHGYRIFKDFEFKPNDGFNLIVGSNESGKSTLLEAMVLALTGRINGRRAGDELNPYWFNVGLVKEFIEKRSSGAKVAPPEIRIEVFFEDRDDLQKLSGAINSEVPTMACPGLSFRVIPNPDYLADLEEWAQNPSTILPVEYYKEDWRDFADNKLTNRPRQLATSVIDSRTVRSTSGIDYHLREILSDNLEPEERVKISLAYRQVKETLSETSLSAVNKRISGTHASLHNKPISLAMDQSARTSWEVAVSPHVGEVPFSMSGQGQQAAVKISLAMNRQSDRSNFVMVEEPENHLSHTSLATLLSRMADLAGDEQQIFVTTHSSYVLNRLGLDSLRLVGSSCAPKMRDLDPGTVAYFKKLPGYDTLRLVLAEKIVLVEGPSDEIVFERVFKDLHLKRPMECGIDVVAMRGLSLNRCLELCSVLDKRVAALRDNDGMEPSELRKDIEIWLSKERRELFIGDKEHGETLEPQLIHFNGEAALRDALKIRVDADLKTWMTREKTEAALRLSESAAALSPPKYMLDAARFIHGEPS